MFKLNILIYCIVYSSAAYASPSVDKRPWSGRGCGNASPQGDESAIATAVAPLRLAIETQAQTIQSLIKSLEAVQSLQKIVQVMNHTLYERTPMTMTTPTVAVAAPVCASGEFVTSAVNAAVFPLQKTIHELNQTIFELTPIITPISTLNCSSEETMRSAVKDALSPMHHTIQELNQTMFYYDVSPTTTPKLANCISDEMVASAVNAATIPLHQTIYEMNQTIIELMAPTTTLTTITTPTPTTTPMPTTTTPIPTTTTTQAPTTTTTQKPVPHCAADYQYNSEMFSCYKRHRNSVHWTVADSTCRGEGAHLAVINSRAEGNTIVNMMQAEGWPWTFLGVYRDSGVWLTVTGERFDAAAGYDVWQRPDWPTNRAVDSARKYVVFYKPGAVNVDDTENHHFICEKKPTY